MGRTLCPGQAKPMKSKSATTTNSNKKNQPKQSNIIVNAV